MLPRRPPVQETDSQLSPLLRRNNYRKLTRNFEFGS
jgi:hypothetical protein